MTELKPCPFCGGEAQLIIRTWDGDGAGADGYDVGCYTPECHVELGADFYFETIDDAIESWNKRTPIKDNIIANTVNKLAKVASKYHGTQQLREQIARVIREVLK